MLCELNSLKKDIKEKSDFKHALCWQEKFFIHDFGHYDIHHNVWRKMQELNLEYSCELGSRATIPNPGQMVTILEPDQVIKVLRKLLEINKEMITNIMLQTAENFLPDKYRTKITSAQSVSAEDKAKILKNIEKLYIKTYTEKKSQASTSQKGEKFNNDHHSPRSHITIVTDVGKFTISNELYSIISHLSNKHPCICSSTNYKSTVIIKSLNKALGINKNDILTTLLRAADFCFNNTEEQQVRTKLLNPQVVKVPSSECLTAEIC